MQAQPPSSASFPQVTQFPRDSAEPTEHEQRPPSVADGVQERADK
eukprot:CAMPEP_0185607404 /NCGR_PEP_ID=MMETSP0436-20130131/5484_1 /TAXON_ID=626734 ORGANISM="Favella taraikaensis, Strain Fe Narragansett Bay" /NCGR_SAMPLE_ID=MMETSP0436 /ASSEMBLY_ACC=CAM_ASM_000390 /LENGTH=44 /DNA_ID= /DNA_START= /DNA_END= /DNA_ORIENTATION=